MSDDILVKQNEILIGLLARSTIGIESIRDIVTRAKKNPRAYIKAYNALTGTLTVTGAAKIAGVSTGTMSQALTSWEEAGIIYDVGEPNRPLYKRLLVLPTSAGEKKD